MSDQRRSGRVRGISVYQLWTLRRGLSGAVPSRLAKFANNGLSDMFEKWNGMECVECGSCSFICPAKRQLAQSIKTMKKTIIAERKKK